MRLATAVKRAVADMRANLLLHLIALSTIGLIFLLAGTFALVYTNVNALMDSWQKKVRIMVYAVPGTSEARLSGIRQAAEALHLVDSVAFISAEQGLEDLRQHMGRQADLLEGLEDNPLPDAFEVTVTASGNWKDIEQTAQSLQATDGVDEVNYGQAWLDKFAMFIELSRWVSLVFGALLVVAAVSITANTIRLVIYNRRQEIEIMRLVGATEGFIRAPFYVEGMLLGLASGLVALAILVFVYLAMTSGMQSGLLLGHFQPRFLPWTTLAGGLMASMVVGAAGCHLSFRQFAAS